MKVASEAIEEGGYKGDFSPAVSLYVAPVTLPLRFLHALGSDLPAAARRL